MKIMPFGRPDPKTAATEKIQMIAIWMAGLIQKLCHLERLIQRAPNLEGLIQRPLFFGRSYHDTVTPAVMFYPNTAKFLRSDAKIALCQLEEKKKCKMDLNP